MQAESFVGEPAALSLFNLVNQKLMEYYQDPQMNLSRFKQLCEEKKSSSALTSAFSRFGLYQPAKPANPLDRLYQLGANIRSNADLVKLNQYLESQLEHRRSKDRQLSLATLKY